MTPAEKRRATQEKFRQQREAAARKRNIARAMVTDRLPTLSSLKRWGARNGFRVINSFVKRMGRGQERRKEFLLGWPGMSNDDAQYILTQRNLHRGK